MFPCLFCVRAISARYAHWLPLAAALLFVSPVWAADPTVLTLDAAIHQAVERAPVLEARRSQSESARQEASRAGALPDPKLTVGKIGRASCRERV